MDVVGFRFSPSIECVRSLTVCADLDIWTQGGLLLFDKRGKLRFAYYESYGDELNIEEIRRAIRAIQEESMDDTTGTSFASSISGDEDDWEEEDPFDGVDDAKIENMEELEDDMMFR